MDVLRPLVHAAAGVFSLAMPLYALVGAVWGVLRPRLTLTLDYDLAAVGPAASGASFRGFFWFVVATCAVSAVMALATYIRAPAARGVAMLIWLALLAALGVAVCGVVGDAVASLIADPPRTIAAPVRRGVAPFIAASLSAAVL